MNSLDKLFLRIEKENEAFKKLTKAEKRVVIAQDCIIRLKSEQFITEQGSLLKGGLFNEEESADLSLKEVLNSNSVVECQVCAKGGLFLSYVGRTNKLKICDIERDNDVNSIEHKALLKIFSVRQLALIEAAYEGKQFIKKDLKGNCIEFSEETVNNLYKFWEKNHMKYDFEEKELDLTYLRNSEFTEGAKFNVKNLLINICKNIIENKGTFIP